MRKFHVTIMRPESDSGRFHVQAFHTVAQILLYGLSALGFDCSFKSNVFVPNDAINVVLAPQFASEKTEFPEGRTILYSLEQLGGNSLHMISPELYKRHMIWDYSPVNIEYWRKLGVDAELVRIGFVPQLCRIESRNYPDIDVLHIGSISPRRKKIIAELLDMPDIKFHLGAGFGVQRDALIARSRVVLNCHFYQSPQILEMVRLADLLPNRKCVVCETSDDFPPALDGAVRVVPYDQLAQACRELVHDVEQRIGYQNRAYSQFSRLRETDILRPIVARLFPT